MNTESVKSIFISRDEIHSKLGRNLSCLQRLELLVKAIASTVEFVAERKASGSELELTRSSCDDATLGSAIPEYLKLFADKREEPEQTGFRAAMKVTLSMSEEEQSNRIQALKDVVAERNWLVHKSLLHLDANDPESVEAWAARLDKQFNEATSLCNELVQEWKMVQEVKADVAEPSLAFLLVALLLSDIKKMKPDAERWISIDRFDAHFRNAKAKLEIDHQIVIGIDSRQYLSTCENIEFKPEPPDTPRPRYFRFV